MRQPTLFDQAIDSALTIPGLTYVPGLFSEDEQQAILESVDRAEWRSDLKRRVQHYGYRYDYKARRVDASMFLGELPAFATLITARLLEIQLLGRPPDQLIINEYLPGQGISTHVDCEPCFASRIATLSLGWAYEMDFIRLADRLERSILLDVGSVVVIADEARHDWAHRIKARKSDRGIPRQRRVSLTFRNVIL